jgi:hypothetical protein
MPRQSFAARFKAQLAPLTQDTQRRVARDVKECLTRYAKVCDIKRGSIPIEGSGDPYYDLRCSLDKLRSHLEVPPEMQAVLALPGYYDAPTTPSALGDAVRQHFDQVAGIGRTWLEELRGFLERTTPKGEPGARPKYTQALVRFVRRLLARASRPDWREVFRECKNRFPDVAFPAKRDSFVRSMQRLIRQGEGERPRRGRR